MKIWFILATILYIGLSMCNFLFYMDIANWKISKFRFKEMLIKQFYLIFIVYTFPLSLFFLKELDE